MAEDSDVGADDPDPGRTESSGDRSDHPAPEDDDFASEADRRLEREIEDLREELESFRDDVEARTVDRASFEAELKRYVRKRVRRGKARGWGPYLVLLYGTAMTIGALVELSGGWAILAMIVIWLSTLGLYTFMVVTGLLFSILGLPRRVVGILRDLRS